MAAIAAVIAATAIAAAEIPDSNKSFTACMLKNVGTIRLIDPSLPQKNLMSHCTRLEQQVNWNGEGQPGTPGAKGDTGATGPRGPAGKDGATGPAGTAGADGTDGATGATGPQGPQGATGATGPQGPAGKDGAPGKDGEDGKAGADGKDGVGVTSQSLSSGADPACPAGGSKFTVAGGNVTYACNGSDGSGQILGGHGQNVRSSQQQEPTLLGHIPGFGDIKLWFNGGTNECRIEFANTSSDQWTGESGSNALTFAPGQSRNDVTQREGSVEAAFFEVGDVTAPQGAEVTVHYYVNALDTNTCTGGFDAELSGS